MGTMLLGSSISTLSCLLSVVVVVAAVFISVGIVVGVVEFDGGNEGSESHDDEHEDGECCNPYVDLVGSEDAQVKIEFVAAFDVGGELKGATNEESIFRAGNWPQTIVSTEIHVHDALRRRGSRAELATASGISTTAATIATTTIVVGIEVESDW